MPKGEMFKEFEGKITAIYPSEKGYLVDLESITDSEKTICLNSFTKPDGLERGMKIKATYHPKENKFYFYEDL